MANLNKVMLIGNLTRDPDLKYTPGNQAVCEIGLAVNRKYRTKEGEDREETTFVDCEAWGKQAEVLKQYMTKGKPLFIEGRLKLDTWEDKDGGKRSKMRVVIENFQFLGAAGGGGGGGGERYVTEEGGSSSRGGSRGGRGSSGGGGGAPHQNVAEEEIPF
ncbi:MAG: single-stranded DNA-binding protein [Proteobacteria bacterium]|jgi:single-strand DNA-binding protein|nr:single-stranded DNA-binding protein [Pseudomonadota bacterium]